ncbi:MAG: carbohydrate-binding domain-containing protein [Clostridia bacterium]|nr:carbohydrate-binding domain-containing protein [Clostridia bacterium]
MKKIKALALAVLMAASVLTACGTGEAGTASGETVSLKNSTEIVLNGDTATCENPSVYITEDRISITAHGTYVLSGTLNDGQIYVDCVDAGEVTLVLKDANIHNEDGACIYIKKAQVAQVELYEGTVNTLSDGDSYVFDNPEEDEPDSCLFSKEDLVIRGTGTLNVDANYMNAIVSKDGLTIADGIYNLNSINHGIKGKDYLTINGGELNISAIGDGIKSTNYETELVGYVEINGGTLNITSDDEAIQGVSRVTFNGGTTNITANNNGIKCAAGIEFKNGTVVLNAVDNALDALDIVVGETASVTINGAPYVG